MKKKISFFKKGFTLIELLVVIAVLGLLASLVLVSLGSARFKAKDAAIKSQLKQLSSAASLFYQDQNPASPVSFCNTPEVGRILVNLKKLNSSYTGYCNDAVNSYLLSSIPKLEENNDRNSWLRNLLIDTALAKAKCDNDGICDSGENISNCPADCGGATCDNDGTCDSGENHSNCPADCVCGDGICNSGENSTNCPIDCTPTNCDGDGTCEPPVETTTNCPADCGGSGCNNNGVCQPSRGENSTNCPLDCAVSPSCDFDGVCDSGENVSNCPSDCTMITCNNNNICEPARGETFSNCISDCHCGNGICDYGETQVTCSSDCGASPSCDHDGTCDPGENVVNCPFDCTVVPICDNDGTCDPTENATTCPADCTVVPTCDYDGVCDHPQETFSTCLHDCHCGNGICEPSWLESAASCVGDCHCGNGICDYSETTASCPGDCGGPTCDNDTICDPGETAANCPADCGSMTCSAEDWIVVFGGGTTWWCFDSRGVMNNNHILINTACNCS